MVKPITAGRMGNFLFQAATAMAYAWKHGLEYTLPDTTNNAFHNPIYLQHLVNPKFDPNLPSVTIQEKQHTYQDLPYKSEWEGKNIFLKGWWQTEKYFKEYRDRIIAEFGFPWKLLKNSVSVHVRRGDYLTLTEKHPPVTKEWYLKAMERFPNHNFTFFSDEPEWCSRNFRGKNISISTGNSEVTDLIAMSCHAHHVCSASTFSWWGAWLNQNPDKKIIIPKLWFQPGRKEDTSDIVPESWIKM